ncbi:MAG TPA: serine/threonine-protein kinase [Desulfobacterales bacterium]|nr:serine/threonine-protein kinase [Desulfobacterales bacterium]HSM90882.1 serine/threonine-protein kinase [Desulfobacterales bacterium]
MNGAFSREQIHEMASRWMARPPEAGALRVVTDTSDFFRLETGDVLLLGGSPYLMRSSVREARFGLDDEVKHWVKRAIDLVTGQTKIVKLVFYEQFTATIGGIVFECFRSPRKEARILGLVNDHPSFMHGLTVPDDRGNLVRVLDYIYGDSLAGRVAGIDQDHEAYLFETLPGILANYLHCVEAVRFLHEHGEKHGDIRRDHILIDADSGHYRWIDFDYNYRHRENIYGYDLFGLGNVLIYVVGKGDVLLADLRRRDPDVLSRLVDEDLNIVFHNRVANLKKVFPHIPDSLNRVLLHFSRGANWFYEHTTQLIQDLQQAMAEIR